MTVELPHRTGCMQEISQQRGVQLQAKRLANGSAKG